MGRGLYIFGSLVSTLLLLMLLSQPAAAANTRVAILPWTNDAGVTAEAVAYLKTLITGAATAELPDSFAVMTQENLEAMLPPGKTLAPLSVFATSNLKTAVPTAVVLFRFRVQKSVI